MLGEYVDLADLQQAIDNKMVNARVRGSYTIYNYSSLAMVTSGAWDSDAVRKCRGLIVNTAQEIVALPWAKFFNHSQPEADRIPLDAKVVVTDKIDGSLGIGYYNADDGAYAIATRGSFVSDQAMHGTEVLRTKYADITWPDWVTPLFEIVYKEGRIVLDYGNTDDLFLLGGTDVSDTGYGYLSPAATMALIHWPGPVAEEFAYSTYADALMAKPRTNAEGIVIRQLGTTKMVKLKQEDYILLHKAIYGLTTKTVWEAMMNGSTTDALCAHLPDELHEWVRAVWLDYEKRLDVNLVTVRGVLDDVHTLLDGRSPQNKDARAEVARYITTHVDKALVGAVFAGLDNKDYRVMLLRQLKPAGGVRPEWTEDES